MRRIALTLALSLVVSTAASAAEVRSRPKTHTVMMNGMSYEPPVLTIKSGDTVIWMNKDVVAHTATAATKSFDSTLIAPGKSWKGTFRKKGDFPYVCTFHPRMTGMLQVR